jgi:hypothetical protein
MGHGHTKGRLCNGGIRQGIKTKNLNEVMCSLYRNEYRNFKLAGSTMDLIDKKCRINCGLVAQCPSKLLR